MNHGPNIQSVGLGQGGMMRRKTSGAEPYGVPVQAGFLGLELPIKKEEHLFIQNPWDQMYSDLQQPHMAPQQAWIPEPGPHMVPPAAPSLAPTPAPTAPGPVTVQSPTATLTTGSTSTRFPGRQGSGDLTDGGSGTESLPDTSKDTANAGFGFPKQKKNNAEACRKFREKRKREVETIRAKNEALSIDREIYLARIARLQTEVQMLRGEGTIDLQKENELLRSEIEKHKVYIRNVVNATNAAPRITPETQYRMLKSGAESGLAQVVGLAYTSNVAGKGSSWSVGQPFVFKGVTVNVRYQYLPIGSCPKTAKRLNIRLDYNNVRKSAKNIHELFWMCHSDTDFLNKVYKTAERKTRVSRKATDIYSCDLDRIKQIFDNLGDLAVFKYSETKLDTGETDQAIFSSSYKMIDIYPSAYVLEEHESEEVLDGEPCKAYVSMTTSTSTSLEEAEVITEDETGSSNLFEGQLLAGSIVRQHNTNPKRCHYTSILSLPIREQDRDRPFIMESGDIGPDLLDCMRVYWKLLDAARFMRKANKIKKAFGFSKNKNKTKS
eukprot:CAMPEP_0203745390 /NCGR_PEP_ID=MMETSP0098-20131031/1143_1 /ASSEMBLY_ACC=CAM_ASM_000208 /TAXON_ID=96639 /ORGANISM=" , Strain NY0313808BC1" /LENGTH=549 /DNA_ID=CAMNT_0050633157 /DNA_START=430 /DNA_END=2079 /DNA_ORIENTATION=+